MRAGRAVGSVHFVRGPVASRPRTLGYGGPVPATPDRAAVPRHDQFTFRANAGAGRHGWLRLTPAYGVRLVREALADLPRGAVVTDPFSGTGTTPLAAAEAGLTGQAVDLNPFLVGLARAKVAHYDAGEIAAARDAAQEVVAGAADGLARFARDGGAADGARGGDDGAQRPWWTPTMHRIDRWWSPGTLDALAALRAGIDSLDPTTATLLEVALCRTVIARSAAAFNHQSMSFAAGPDAAPGVAPGAAPGAAPDPTAADRAAALAHFADQVAPVLDSAAESLPGTATIAFGDSRDALPTLVDAGEFRPADLLFTSPPYANRMSYVRELRPYMYWTRHLSTGAEAGELDWRAIGGTWGTATGRLGTWEPVTDTPVDAAIAEVGARIVRDGGKNGPLLATYVHRYHHDMWLHLHGAVRVVRSGGRLVYVVGNSTFFGHEVPVHEWYAAMLQALGLRDVGVKVVRKRSSKKALFEYAVSATSPFSDR